MDYKLMDISEVIKSIGKEKKIVAVVLENIRGLADKGVYDIDYLKIKTVASLLAEKNVVFFEKKEEANVWK